jgi:hypothetical protein
MKLPDYSNNKGFVDLADSSFLWKKVPAITRGLGGGA